MAERFAGAAALPYPDWGKVGNKVPRFTEVSMHH
jgi:hypothetical protein